MMILALNNDESGWTIEQTEGIVHLNALAYRNVVVCHAVNKQQWSVYLVGKEQRTAVDKQLVVSPRITVCHRHLAVGIAPIAFTPIAGVVADACMGDGCGKDVGLGLQILRHKTTIRSTDTSYLLGIDERMVVAEFLRSLYDVLGWSLAGCVDVARRELLTEASGTTWLHDIDDIAHSGIEMVRITALEIAARWRATAVVVDYERIFLGRVEMWRQIVAATDGVATRVDEIPCLALAKLHVAETLRMEVFYHDWLKVLKVHAVKAVGV